MFYLLLLLRLILIVEASPPPFLPEDFFSQLCIDKTQ